MTDPYNHDDDDDQPTLQRVSPTSTKIAAAAQLFEPFPDESTTATDLDVLASGDPGIDAGPVAHARDFVDVDTEKMPLEVRAGLVRASQVDESA